MSTQADIDLDEIERNLNMDRARIAEEMRLQRIYAPFCFSDILSFSEHIAAIARNEALNEAEEAIYLLEKDMKCVNAIRALKEAK
jgi:hypothetical protein